MMITFLWWYHWHSTLIDPSAMNSLDSISCFRRHRERIIHVITMKIIKVIFLLGETMLLEECRDNFNDWILTSDCHFYNQESLSNSKRYTWRNNREIIFLMRLNQKSVNIMEKLWAKPLRRKCNSCHNSNMKIEIGNDTNNRCPARIGGD